MLRYVYRALFWALATIGRPIGGIPPRRITLWLARRAYEHRSPQPHEYRWVRDNGRLEFLLHPHYINDVEVIAFGAYDRGLQRFIRSRLTSGMVCVDVGANVGFVSLNMARAIAPGGKVYAFEPVPFLFEKLQRNIRRNRLEGVVAASRCAVSHRSEKARMAVGDESVPNQGLALLLGPITETPSAGLEIDCTSLDDFADRERLAQLDLIKIDVQGAEALVIEGATSCLARFGPDIVMELSSGLSPVGRDPQETVRLVEEAGYGVFELTDSGIGREIRSADCSPGFAALNVVCRKRRSDDGSR